MATTITTRLLGVSTLTLMRTYNHGLDGRRVADGEDSQKWFACESPDENIANLTCDGWPRQLSVDRAQETTSDREQMRRPIGSTGTNTRG